MAAILTLRSKIGELFTLRNFSAKKWQKMDAIHILRCKIDKIHILRGLTAPQCPKWLRSFRGKMDKILLLRGKMDKN